MKNKLILIITMVALWVPKLNFGQTTKSDVEIVDAKGLATVYPNPFNESINIVMNETPTNKLEFEIFNVLGREVLSIFILKQKTNLETNELPSGIYFFKLYENDKIIQTGKLIDCPGLVDCRVIN